MSDQEIKDLSSATMNTKISVSNTFQLLHGDCLEKMNELQPQSIDCIINDPPYGCTDNKWDTPLDLEKMWECYLRVLKPNGTVIMFCCSDTRTDEPLLGRLMVSKPTGWKYYTLVYPKSGPTSPMNAIHRPMRIHEDIIVFYKSAQHTYNPQMVEKQYYGAKVRSKNLGSKESSLMQPRSILPIFPRQKTDNSTSKPVGTMEWLVKTYTDEYDTVLDNTMGSGSTGVACANTHRNFVGIEADPEQFPQTQHRIEKAYKKTLREALEEDDDGIDPTNIELPERLPKFDVADYTKFYETVSQLSDYDTMLSWLVKYINQYFCIIADPHEIIESVYGQVEEQMMACTPLMEEEKEKKKRALQFVRRKPAEVKLRFRKCLFHSENGKKSDLYDAWSRSIENREYSSKVFDPTMSVSYDDRNILNTFVGLKAEQEVVFDQNNTSFHVNPEDFDTILYHIKNLCGGNDLYYEYLLDWLAYPIQTGEKTGVAVICYGGQGCGKSKIFEELMGIQIYGEQYASKISGGTTQIGGSFNSHISGKMFLNIVEPNDFSKAKLNILKDLITSSKAEVNAKNKDAVFEDDYTNYVFTCNKIPKDMLEEDDRRYFIIQHNGEKGDRMFYNDLAFCVETQAHEFYKFLKMREIKHFEFGKKPPQTEVKKRLLTMAIDPIFKYLQHLAESDALAYYFKRPSDGVPVLPYRSFVNNATEWCDQECESPSWKKKPVEMKEILNSKLGQEDCCFEPVVTRVIDNLSGKMKNDRCVLFPKTSDALLDLLVRKKVYTDLHDEGDDDTLAELKEDLPDYEDVVDYGFEAKQAEMVELDNMIRREQMRLNRDEFDQE